MMVVKASIGTDRDRIKSSKDSITLLTSENTMMKRLGGDGEPTLGGGGGGGPHYEPS